MCLEILDSSAELPTSIFSVYLFAVICAMHVHARPATVLRLCRHPDMCTARPISVRTVSLSYWHWSRTSVCLVCRHWSRGEAIGGAACGVCVRGVGAALTKCRGNVASPFGFLVVPDVIVVIRRGSEGASTHEHGEEMKTQEPEYRVQDSSVSQNLSATPHEKYHIDQWGESYTVPIAIPNAAQTE